MRADRQSFPPEAWGFRSDEAGALCVGSTRLTDLAAQFGTPLHVVNLARLRNNARMFVRHARLSIRPDVSVHFALKSNSVPAVVREVRNEGLRAEVMSLAELNLALSCGYAPDDVIVNGPCKSDEFLRACVTARVRAISVDSLEEIERIDAIATELQQTPSVLLRVNPDISPRGLHRGSVAGSRVSSAFGLDLKGGEVDAALQTASRHRVRLEGFHIHAGTGVRDPKVYSRVVSLLAGMVSRSRRIGYDIRILDLGGGYPSGTSRGYSNSEMFFYGLTGRAPSHGSPPPAIEQYLLEIGNVVRKEFRYGDCPTIVLEPGRSIVSDAQCLLLGVESVKQRTGIPPWIITDGGLGTVTMPTYYESHEILLCNDVRRPVRGRATILGPGCFAGDVVVRNKRMPEVSRGEVLAVMDSGAYFTALESNFGHPRPAIVAVEEGEVRLLRRREDFGNMISRDLIFQEEIVS